jgi:hypothetical protein
MHRAIAQCGTAHSAGARWRASLCPFDFQGMETAMRWIWLAISILGFVVAYKAAEPGLLGMGVLAGFIGATMCVFSFVALRVQDVSRPDTAILSPEELVAMRKRSEAQRLAGGAKRPPVAARGPAAAPTRLPPSRVPPTTKR